MLNFHVLGGIAEGQTALSFNPNNKPIPWKLLNRLRMSVISYAGGKFHLLDSLIPLLEWVGREYNLDTYVEATGGACRCLLNLDPSRSIFQQRVYSDVDYSLCCLFYVLSDEYLTELLINRLSRLDYNEPTFKAAVAANKYDNDQARRGIFHEDYVFSACNIYVATMMSRASSMKSFEWLIAMDVKERDKYFERALRLHQFNSILSRVTFFRKDCRQLIKEIETGEAGYDRKRTLCYIDPPYTEHEMKSKKHYAFSWNDQDHINFRDLIKHSETYMIISSYTCEIFDELKEKYGWDKVFLKRKHVSMSGTGEMADEWIYINFPISDELRNIITLGEPQD